MFGRGSKMKTFEEWFKKYTKNNGFPIRKKSAKTVWRATLERILQEMQNDPYKRNMELEDWIKEEMIQY